MRGVSFSSGTPTEQISTRVFRIDDSAVGRAPPPRVWNAHPKLKVCSWNVGGVQREMLVCLLERIAQQSVDVVLLQEVLSNSPVAFTLEGDTWWCYVGESFGGVKGSAIFFRKNFGEPGCAFSGEGTFGLVMGRLPSSPCTDHPWVPRRLSSRV